MCGSVPNEVWSSTSLRARGGWGALVYGLQTFSFFQRSPFKGLLAPAQRCGSPGCNTRSGCLLMCSWAVLSTPCPVNNVAFENNEFARPCC